MSNDKGFNRGLLAGMLVMLGASAIHWFITPMAHPDASTMQRFGVIVQALIGLGGFVWLTWRNRQCVSA